MDKAWIKRLILLDAVLVAVLGWLAYTVWVEAQEARAAKRATGADPAAELAAPVSEPSPAIDAPTADPAGSQ